RPYLLSHNEIEAFFGAAGRLKTASPWAWQARAFFTLMHSCGMRTGEVRDLECGHVNLDDGHIDVMWSKGRRSRRLPVSDEVTQMLAQAHHTSRKHFAGRRHFFVSSTGNPVTPAAVGVVFNRIWDGDALARMPGGKLPRPYDFRHHFAYTNIERWMAQGTDVTAMLPYLARYMGHATFESTYYFVHTSPDFMDAYADITRGSASVLPQVGFE